ncbi:MAG TPA: class I SAM-dependent methyltransferase [Actinomycetota bacterium]|jgi:protein-L-isoaspartate O-methyltransferase|nr:class I SAM-dependent methyltransferase [Actinomycetota bacterium]
MVDEADREVQKWTFDPIAELYDRVRPAYPIELLTDLTEPAGIGPGSRVLEIGCGTGKLTVQMAELGCEIIAVELGSNLADLARRNLASFPHVSVVTGSFEEWSPPAEPFDAVVSATAFHWLDPVTRVPKAADVLQPGGSLAIVITHHVAREQDTFFDDAQECFERWDPGYVPGSRPPRPEDVPIDTQEIEASGKFDTPVVRRYEWELEYSTTEFIDLISTYSANLVLEPEARSGLFDCTADLIDTRYGGRVTKPYLNELQVARLSS